MMCIYVVGFFFFEESFLFFLVIHLSEMTVSYLILDREKMCCFSREKLTYVNTPKVTLCLFK